MIMNSLVQETVDIFTGIELHQRNDDNDNNNDNDDDDDDDDDYDKRVKE